MLAKCPLPSHRETEELFSAHSLRVEIVNAYSICWNVVHVVAENERQTIYARILAYLVIHGPNDQARACVIADIASCDRDVVKLLELGEFYFNHYIRPFKRCKEPPSESSGRVSRPFFDNLEDMVSAMSVLVPKDYQEAKKNALVRDGFRCMLSGVYDRISMQQNDTLRAKVKEFDRPGTRIGAVGSTQCAHIFSNFGELTNHDILDDDSNCHRAGSMRTILERFGYGSILQELNGSGVHRLENTLTLLSDVRDRFERLELWFEETSTEHQYNIGAVDPEEVFEFSRLPRQVKFETEHHNMALPSPIYLKLHAACAKIAHLSGAGEYIENFQRDIEETDVLASDGSSTDLLHDALLSLKAIAIGV